MDFIISNWYVFIAVFAVGLCVGVAVYRFAKMPTSEQLQKVREWLLYAVTEAEREFGSGTGQIKLRNVYDLFVQRFPWLVRVVSFAAFGDLVDDALVDMRKMLNENKDVKTLVEGPEAAKE